MTLAEQNFLTLVNVVDYSSCKGCPKITVGTLRMFSGMVLTVCLVEMVPAYGYFPTTLNAVLAVWSNTIHFILSTGISTKLR